MNPSPHPPAPGPNPGEPEPPRDAATACVEQLRAALADHDIKLPSLTVDAPTYASTAPYAHPLVSLGNCRLDVARRLIEVLRAAGPGGRTGER